ncbi:N-formylglutamate amidohydrolase [Leisingera sp.]|uniref:N-formylglutamate amidohydrolase n=1 Tax=Leisingera sp. TaxID=1879318 RepID=UPI002B278E87|nr:N-formylglutamate amidohydrolase [Leisingera sp.]
MTYGNVKSDPATLLGPRDPAPVELLNSASRHPVLLVCEHAGQQIPERLSGLGLSRTDLDRHIGWDIGAAAVTRKLAHAMGAPAVLQAYSRLVIDCNRPPEAPDAMPLISDGTPVPGNRGLTQQDRAARVSGIFAPYQAAVTETRGQPERQLLISIHSFTARMAGEVRPWDIAFLYRGDADTPERLRHALLEQAPELSVGMNEPYQIDDESDWFVPRHGEASGLPHSLIEIRNDLIADDAGQSRWAGLLRTAIESLL